MCALRDDVAVLRESSPCTWDCVGEGGPERQREAAPRAGAAPLSGAPIGTALRAYTARPAPTESRGGTPTGTPRQMTRA
eukprot:scaffold1646_cov384-Prasinococcus_capsulatus_cf.AAC.10